MSSNPDTQTPTLPTLALDAATIDALADAVADRIAAQLPAAQDRHLADDDILDSREAAAYLRLSMDGLYKRTARGEIQTLDRGGKGNRLRFRKRWLDDWLEGEVR